MKRKQIVLHSVAKQLFVTGGESQHGLKERPKEEYGTGRNKLLGEKYSKHCTDFQYYYPNTISYKAITVLKSMETRLLRNRPFFFYFEVLRNNSGDVKRAACGARGFRGRAAPRSFRGRSAGPHDRVRGLPAGAAEGLRPLFSHRTPAAGEAEADQRVGSGTESLSELRSKPNTRQYQIRSNTKYGNPVRMPSPSSVCRVCFKLIASLLRGKKEGVGWGNKNNNNNKSTKRNYADFFPE